MGTEKDTAGETRDPRYESFDRINAFLELLDDSTFVKSGGLGPLVDSFRAQAAMIRNVDSTLNEMREVLEVQVRFLFLMSQEYAMQAQTAKVPDAP